MMRSRGAPVAIAATLGLIVAGFVGAPPAEAKAECASGISDFNGDGTKDLAVGAPGAEVDGQKGAGRVDVTLDFPDGDLPDASADKPQAGDQFGAAVNDMDLADEGDIDQSCSYLVVGAPGRDVDGKKDAGAVFLYSWDIEHEGFKLIKEITQESGSGVQAGARFGSSLASQSDGQGKGDLARDPVLYVGAPGYDVGAVKDAGAVERMEFNLTFTDLQPELKVTDTTSLTQGAKGVPGKNESGDNFGHALVTGRFANEVIIGAPGQTIGGVKAGQITHWKESGGSRAFNQNTADVPGTNEKGDKFGSVLWLSTEVDDATPRRDEALFVGMPHEDIGDAKDAGAVMRVGYSDNTEDGTLQLDDAKRFDQASPGVVGKPEPGDRFGSAIESLGWEPGKKPIFMVGAPGEKNGSVAGAGRVVSLGGGISWTQETLGIDLEDEPGDGFGSTLAGLRHDSDDGYEWASGLVMGIPGKHDGAGIVVVGVGWGGGDGQVVTPPDPLVPDAGYGSALVSTR